MKRLYEVIFEAWPYMPYWPILNNWKREVTAEQITTVYGLMWFTKICTEINSQGGERFVPNLTVKDTKVA